VQRHTKGNTMTTTDTTHTTTHTITGLHDGIEAIVRAAMQAWPGTAAQPHIHRYWRDTTESLPLPLAVVELVDMQPDDVPSGPDGRPLFDARFSVTLALDPLLAYDVGGYAAHAELAVRDLAAHVWLALHTHRRLPDCSPFVLAQIGEAQSATADSLRGYSMREIEFGLVFALGETYDPVDIELNVLGETPQRVQSTATPQSTLEVQL
jgi:hypothetical protein